MNNKANSNLNLKRIIENYPIILKDWKGVLNKVAIHTQIWKQLTKNSIYKSFVFSCYMWHNPNHGGISQSDPNFH